MSIINLCWIRQLRIILTSPSYKQQVVYGEQDGDDLDIEVNGSKYLSALKDNFVVKIKNLPYNDILHLIKYNYNRVEVKAGYKGAGGPVSIFKGYVNYISNDPEDGKTNCVYIICSSILVGLFQNKRLNMSLNSGINMYAALEYVCKMAGISTSNISQEFRDKFINEVKSNSGSPASMLDALLNTSENANYTIMSDSTLGNTVTIQDLYRTNNRVIKINKEGFVLVDGYPTISVDGLSISLLPTYNFLPGDMLVVDPTLVNMSVKNQNEVYSKATQGYYLGTYNEQLEGMVYVAYQLDYSLSNKGGEFKVSILAKNRDLYQIMTGVSKK